MSDSVVGSHVVVHLEEVTNTCFVVMPFKPLFQSEYERVIRPALEAAGLSCVRGDEIYTQQSIIQDVWRSIRQARLVVAELSERNPNVMYEIGLAHAIGKTIIFLTRDENDVPFDLRTLRYIYYDPNNPFWGADLQTELTKLVHLVLSAPHANAHLAGVQVHSANLPAPTQALTATASLLPEHDLSGAWETSWLAVRSQRWHVATLVIASGHGSTFTASMTVSYLRNGENTIVQETLSGSLQGRKLSLAGVNYTYVRQGKSRAYNLDSFQLSLSDDSNVLEGIGLFMYGSVNVQFKRLPQPPAPA